MILYFVSNNQYKLREVQNILSDSSLTIKPFESKIDEIQSDNANLIIKDKLLKAFKIVKRPVFVEHTGLYIKDFGNLPGGLTQVIWDSLQADKFCSYFGNNANNLAEAKTIIGYCDGKKIMTFEGSINGKISSSPQGNKDFQWDCVFIPSGYEKTFAELGEEKNNISMRKIALEKLKNYLEGA